MTFPQIIQQEQWIICFYRGRKVCQHCTASPLTVYNAGGLMPQFVGFPLRQFEQ